MCGIVGFWEAEALARSFSSIVEQMMDPLFHRGPDGRGFYCDESRGLAMGHTRLSIIDLHTGEQPLRDRERGLVLTTNGEFYDYKPLRADLVTRGYRFQTKSDSEIALHLYDRFGLDFVQHLRGEFAFALFDANEDQLILVRDRFGIKPLYYHLQGGSLRWASEVKALLAHPQVPQALDERASINQLMHVMVPGTTAFSEIKALRPGHRLIVRRRGGTLELRDECYWDMEFPLAREHDTNADPEQYVAGVRDQLIDAVRTRLEADVPVGCYLSGGIDSCSILGLATAMQQSPVKAFTISFDDADYDESSIAREMADATGADQEVLSLKAAELYGDSYRRTVWHSERTFYNTLGVAKWHMSRRVHELGFKVVVTGEGSDEMFAGYPFLKRDYFRHAPECDTGAFARQMEQSNAVFRGAILAENEAKHPAFEELIGFTPAWIQPWLLTLDAVRPLLSPNTRELLEEYDPVAAIVEQLNPEMLRERHPLDQAQYTWIKTMLEGQILTWGGDRVDMANSMESRPAFLDHHLAEYAATIPPSVRIRNGIEKWVLREAMKGVLPKVLYEREKFAFMAPPSHTDNAKQAAVAELMDRHGNAERIGAVNILDAKAVEQFRASCTVETDRPTAVRNDILLNHILGLHLLDEFFVQEEAVTP